MRKAEEAIPRTDREITIKGTSDGLIINLGLGPLDKVVEEVEARLRAKASFFRGGRVSLHVAGRALSADQLESIGLLLEELGMSLWAVESDHPETLVAARELGLEAMAHRQPEARGEAVQMGRPEMSAGLVVRRTIRSGQTVHHAGHIVVIGDVNPGAELVAGGDVVVWGRLRGTAHAGAMGDEDAVICALQLTPSQIRIGSLIARPPERGQPPDVPEIATVQNGQIVVERWDETG
jgi:septum site-determining protein MinC